jgi:hypothetical protein
MGSRLSRLSSELLKLRDQLNGATLTVDAAITDEKIEAEHEVYVERVSRRISKVSRAIARTPASSTKDLVEKAYVVMDWANEDGDLSDHLTLSLCRDVIDLHERDLQS